jgi:hypothetical protein
MQNTISRGLLSNQRFHSANVKYATILEMNNEYSLTFNYSRS